MRKEKLKTIDLIPFRTFKEKIELTKQYKDCKVQIIDKYVYVERCKND